MIAASLFSLPFHISRRLPKIRHAAIFSADFRLLFAPAIYFFIISLAIISRSPLRALLPPFHFLRLCHFRHFIYSSFLHFAADAFSFDAFDLNRPPRLLFDISFRHFTFIRRFTKETFFLRRARPMLY